MYLCVAPAAAVIVIVAAAGACQNEVEGNGFVVLFFCSSDITSLRMSYGHIDIPFLWTFNVYECLQLSSHSKRYKVYVSFSLWNVAMDRAVNSDPVDTADTGRMVADFFLMTNFYDR